LEFIIYRKIVNIFQIVHVLKKMKRCMSTFIKFSKGEFSMDIMGVKEEKKGGAGISYPGRV